MLSPIVEAASISQNFGQKKANEDYMSLEDLAEEMLSMEDDKIMEFINQPKLICTRYGAKESNSGSVNLYRFVCSLTSKEPTKIAFSLGYKNTDFLGFVASDPDAIEMKNNINDRVVLLVSPRQNYTYRTVFSLMFSTEAKEPKLKFNAKKAKNIYVKNPDEFEQFLGAVHFYETTFLYKKRYEERTGYEAQFNFGFAEPSGGDIIKGILDSLSQEEIGSLLGNPIYFQADGGEYKIWLLGDKVNIEKNGQPVGSATLVIYISPGAPIVEESSYSEITPETPTGAFLYNPSAEGLTQSTLEVKEGEKLKEDIQGQRPKTETKTNAITGLFLKEKLDAIVEWFKNIFAPKEKEIDEKEIDLAKKPESLISLPPSEETSSEIKFFDNLYDGHSSFRSSDHFPLGGFRQGFDGERSLWMLEKPIKGQGDDVLFISLKLTDEEPILKWGSENFDEEILRIRENRIFRWTGTSWEEVNDYLYVKDSFMLDDEEIKAKINIKDHLNGELTRSNLEDAIRRSVKDLEGVELEKIEFGAVGLPITQSVDRSFWYEHSKKSIEKLVNEFKAAGISSETPINEESITKIMSVYSENFHFLSNYRDVPKELVAVQAKLSSSSSVEEALKILDNFDPAKTKYPYIIEDWKKGMEDYLQETGKLYIHGGSADIPATFGADYAKNGDMICQQHAELLAYALRDIYGNDIDIKLVTFNVNNFRLPNGEFYFLSRDDEGKIVPRVMHRVVLVNNKYVLDNSENAIHLFQEKLAKISFEKRPWWKFWAPKYTLGEPEMLADISKGEFSQKYSDSVLSALKRANAEGFDVSKGEVMVIGKGNTFSVDIKVTEPQLELLRIDFNEAGKIVSVEKNAGEFYEVLKKKAIDELVKTLNFQDRPDLNDYIKRLTIEIKDGKLEVFDPTTTAWARVGADGKVETEVWGGGMSVDMAKFQPIDITIAKHRGKLAILEVDSFEDGKITFEVYGTLPPFGKGVEWKEEIMMGKTEFLKKYMNKKIPCDGGVCSEFRYLLEEKDLEELGLSSYKVTEIDYVSVNFDGTEYKITSHDGELRVLIDAEWKNFDGYLPGLYYEGRSFEDLTELENWNVVKDGEIIDIEVAGGWNIKEGPKEFKSVLDSLTHEDLATLLGRGQKGEILIGNKFIIAKNVERPTGETFDIYGKGVLSGVKADIEVYELNWIPFTDNEGQNFLIKPDAIKKAKMFSATTGGETIGIFIGPEEPIFIGEKQFYLATDCIFDYGSVGTSDPKQLSALKREIPDGFEAMFRYHSHPSPVIQKLLAELYPDDGCGLYKSGAYLSSGDMYSIGTKAGTKTFAQMVISGSSSKVKIFDKWPGREPLKLSEDNTEKIVEQMEMANTKGLIKSFDLDGPVGDLVFDEKKIVRLFGEDSLELLSPTGDPGLKENGIVTYKLKGEPYPEYYKTLDDLESITDKNANPVKISNADPKVNSRINKLDIEYGGPPKAVFQKPEVPVVETELGGKPRVWTINYGSNLDGNEVVNKIKGNIPVNYKKATVYGLTREIRSRWNVIPDENGLVKGTVTDISDIDGDWNKMTEFLKKEGAPGGAYNLYRFTKTKDGWKVEKASGSVGEIDKWVETDELRGINFDIEGEQLKTGDQLLLLKMNPDGKRITKTFEADALDYYEKCLKQMKKIGYTDDVIIEEFVGSKLEASLMGLNGEVKVSKLVNDDGEVAIAIFGTTPTKGEYHNVLILKPSEGEIDLKPMWKSKGINNLKNPNYKFSTTSLRGYEVREVGLPGVIVQKPDVSVVGAEFKGKLDARSLKNNIIKHFKEQHIPSNAYENLQYIVKMENTEDGREIYALIFKEKTTRLTGKVDCDYIIIRLNSDGKILSDPYISKWTQKGLDRLLSGHKFGNIKSLEGFKKTILGEDDIRELARIGIFDIEGDFGLSKLSKGDETAIAVYGTKPTKGKYYNVYVLKDGKIDFKNKWSQTGIDNLKELGHQFKTSSLAKYKVDKVGVPEDFFKGLGGVETGEGISGVSKGMRVGSDEVPFMIMKTNIPQEVWSSSNKHIILVLHSVFDEKTPKVGEELFKLYLENGENAVLLTSLIPRETISDLNRQGGIDAIIKYLKDKGILKDGDILECIHGSDAGAAIFYKPPGENKAVFLKEYNWRKGRYGKAALDHDFLQGYIKNNPVFGFEMSRTQRGTPEAIRDALADFRRGIKSKITGIDEGYFKVSETGEEKVYKYLIRGNFDSNGIELRGGYSIEGGRWSNFNIKKLDEVSPEEFKKLKKLEKAIAEKLGINKERVPSILTSDGKIEIDFYPGEGAHFPKKDYSIFESFELKVSEPTAPTIKDIKQAFYKKVDFSTLPEQDLKECVLEVKESIKDFINDEKAFNEVLDNLGITEDQIKSIDLEYAGEGSFKRAYRITLDIGKGEDNPSFVLSVFKNEIPEGDSRVANVMINNINEEWGKYAKFYDTGIVPKPLTKDFFELNKRAVFAVEYIPPVKLTELSDDDLSKVIEAYGRGVFEFWKKSGGYFLKDPTPGNIVFTKTADGFEMKIIDVDLTKKLSETELLRSVYIQERSLGIDITQNPDGFYKQAYSVLGEKDAEKFINKALADLSEEKTIDNKILKNIKESGLVELEPPKPDYKLLDDIFNKLDEIKKNIGDELLWGFIGRENQPNMGKVYRKEFSWFENIDPDEWNKMEIKEMSASKGVSLSDEKLEKVSIDIKDEWYALGNEIRKKGNLVFEAEGGVGLLESKFYSIVDFDLPKDVPISMYLVTPNGEKIEINILGENVEIRKTGTGEVIKTDIGEVKVSSEGDTIKAGGEEISVSKARVEAEVEGKKITSSDIIKGFNGIHDEAAKTLELDLMITPEGTYKIVSGHWKEVSRLPAEASEFDSSFGKFTIPPGYEPIAKNALRVVDNDGNIIYQVIFLNSDEKKFSLLNYWISGERKYLYGKGWIEIDGFEIKPKGIFIIRDGYSEFFSNEIITRNGIKFASTGKEVKLYRYGLNDEWFHITDIKGFSVGKQGVTTLVPMKYDLWKDPLVNKLSPYGSVKITSLESGDLIIESKYLGGTREVWVPKKWKDRIFGEDGIIYQKDSLKMFTHPGYIEEFPGEWVSKSFDPNEFIEKLPTLQKEGKEISFAIGDKAFVLRKDGKILEVKGGKELEITPDDIKDLIKNTDNIDEIKIYEAGMTEKIAKTMKGVNLEDLNTEMAGLMFKSKEGLMKLTLGNGEEILISFASDGTDTLKGLKLTAYGTDSDSLKTINSLLESFNSKLSTKGIESVDGVLKMDEFTKLCKFEGLDVAVDTLKLSKGAGSFLSEVAGQITGTDFITALTMFAMSKGASKLLSQNKHQKDYMDAYFMREATYEVFELVPQAAVAACVKGGLGAAMGTGAIGGVLGLGIIGVVCLGMIYLEEVHQTWRLKEDIERATGEDIREFVDYTNAFREVLGNVRRGLFERDALSVETQLSMAIQEKVSKAMFDKYLRHIEEDGLKKKGLTIQSLASKLNTGTMENNMEWMKETFGENNVDYDGELLRLRVPTGKKEYTELEFSLKEDKWIVNDAATYSSGFQTSSVQSWAGKESYIHGMSSIGIQSKTYSDKFIADFYDYVEKMIYKAPVKDWEKYIEDFKKTDRYKEFAKRYGEIWDYVFADAAITYLEKDIESKKEELNVAKSRYSEVSVGRENYLYIQIESQEKKLDDAKKRKDELFAQTDTLIKEAFKEMEESGKITEEQREMLKSLGYNEDKIEEFATQLDISKYMRENPEKVNYFFDRVNSLYTFADKDHNGQLSDSEYQEFNSMIHMEVFSSGARMSGLERLPPEDREALLASRSDTLGDEMGKLAAFFVPNRDAVNQLMFDNTIQISAYVLAEFVNSADFGVPEEKIMKICKRLSNEDCEALLASSMSISEKMEIFGLEDRLEGLYSLATEADQNKNGKIDSDEIGYFYGLLKNFAMETNLETDRSKALVLLNDIQNCFINKQNTDISTDIINLQEEGDLHKKTIILKNLESYLPEDFVLKASQIYTHGVGGFSQAIEEIIQAADKNNNGQIDPEEKDELSKRLYDFATQIDPENGPAIISVAFEKMKKINDIMIEIQESGEITDEQIKELKDLGVDEQTIKAIEDSLKGVPKVNAPQVKTIEEHDDGTKLIEYADGSTELVGADDVLLEATYTSSREKSIFLPTLGGVNIDVYGIKSKDVDGDGNPDITYYFTEEGQDLEDAIKVDISNPNFFTSSGKYYYKYGDWGLTDSDKDTCYGNCMKWSNGKVSVYGPGGFLRYTFDDKDGDFKPDVDEDGKYSYHFYNNDGDGVPDSSDVDDDNDGVPDYIEAVLETDPKDPSSKPGKNEIESLANKKIFLGVKNNTLPGHTVSVYQKFIYDEDGNLKGIQTIEEDRYRDPKTGNIITKSKITHSPPIGIGNEKNIIKQPLENPMLDKLKPYDTPQPEWIEKSTTKELIDKLNSKSIKTEDFEQIKQELYERLTSGKYSISNLEHMLGHGGNAEILINNILAQSAVEGYTHKDFDIPEPPTIISEISPKTDTGGASSGGSNLKDKCWRLCRAMGEDCEEMCGSISPTSSTHTATSTQPTTSPSTTIPRPPLRCERFGMCGAWPNCRECENAPNPQDTCMNPPCPN